MQDARVIEKQVAGLAVVLAAADAMDAVALVHQTDFRDIGMAVDGAHLTAVIHFGVCKVNHSGLDCWLGRGRAGWDRVHMYHCRHSLSQGIINFYNLLL